MYLAEKNHTTVMQKCLSSFTNSALYNYTKTVQNSTLTTTTTNKLSK